MSATGMRVTKPLGARAADLGEAVAAAGPRRWAIFFAVLALIVRFPFLFGRHVTPPNSDNSFYLVLASDLVHHGSLAGQHFWTPGYPAFEGLLELLPGRVEDAVTIAQHLLGIAVVVTILLVAWRYFGRAAALTAATLAAVTPVLVVHEHTLLPDFLFGVLVFAGAIVLAEATRREPLRLRLLIVVGLLFGAATWVKPAGELLLVAAAPALLFATRSVRRTLAGTGIVALAMIIVVSPWIVRNTVRWDLVGMSDQGGRILYFRVFDRQRLPLPLDARYGPLAAAAERNSHAAFPAAREQAVHKALLRQAHLNDDTAGAVEQRLALTAIRRHPVAYLSHSWTLLGASLAHIRSFDGKSELLAELDATRPPFPVAVTRAIWHVARALTDVWWIVSLQALSSLLLLVAGGRERRNAAAALLSVWLVLSVATVLSHGGLWRYSIQLAPITWILGSAGAALMVQAIVARVRGSRPPADSRT